MKNHGCKIIETNVDNDRLQELIMDKDYAIIDITTTQDFDHNTFTSVEYYLRMTDHDLIKDVEDNDE